MESQTNDNTDEYDREFINLIYDIEKKSSKLNKYDQLRVKNWCKKLCQVTNNIEWKKNRNLHAISLLDSVLNQRFEEPYDKFPKDGPIPIINKTLVRSKLSAKFFKESAELQNQNFENNNNDRVIEEPELEDRLNSNENIDNSDNNNFNAVFDTNGNIDYDKTVKNKEGKKKEIEELKELIERLKTEVVQRDETLNKLNGKKEKIEKNIFELEKMLSQYLETGN